MRLPIYMIVPFAFLPETEVSVFIEKEHARSYLEQHAMDDLRMIRLCHVGDLNVFSNGFCYAAITLEDCGVKVHELLNSPALAEDRTDLPITESRMYFVRAALCDAIIASVQRA